MQAIQFPDPPAVVPIPPPPDVVFDDPELGVAARGSVELEVCRLLGIPPKIMRNVMGRFIMSKCCNYCGYRMMDIHLMHQSLEQLETGLCSACYECRS